jgi:hypothetical protein
MGYSFMASHSTNQSEVVYEWMEGVASQYESGSSVKPLIILIHSHTHTLTLHACSVIVIISTNVMTNGE